MHAVVHPRNPTTAASSEKGLIFDGFYGLQIYIQYTPEI